MTTFIAAKLNFANVSEHCTGFKTRAELCTEHPVHGLIYWLEYDVYMYVFEIYKNHENFL